MDGPRMPGITLRQEDIEEMHREFPVREVRILVAGQDWDPFIAMAYDGMEIPVRVEGDGSLRATAVLIGVDCERQSITVVI